MKSPLSQVSAGCSELRPCLVRVRIHRQALRRYVAESV